MSPEIVCFTGAILLFLLDILIVVVINFNLTFMTFLQIQMQKVVNDVIIYLPHFCGHVAHTLTTSRVTYVMIRGTHVMKCQPIIIFE